MKIYFYKAIKNIVFFYNKNRKSKTILLKQVFAKYLE